MANDTVKKYRQRELAEFPRWTDEADTNAPMSIPHPTTMEELQCK
ncbi:hypothetical protein [Heyndrickxia sp. FSL W8-0423]